MKEFWNLVVLAVCGTYGVCDLSLCDLTTGLLGVSSRNFFSRRAAWQE